jgi:SAM-dependent methyltransferase
MPTRLGSLVFRLLAEPATRGMDVDDPRMTGLRRDLAKTKRGLYLSYLDWYRALQEVDRKAPPGARVELGSGGGFLEERIPELVRTDLMRLPWLDLVCRGEQLPLRDGSVGALFLLNVFHHVISPQSFLEEVTRVLRPGGYLAMIEPWVTPFARLVYGKFHPEPYEPDAPEWDLDPAGPLSGGNDALPWIVFSRDREKFERLNPRLEIESVRPHTGFTHLASGGVMVRSLAPGFILPLLRRVESLCGERCTRMLALFVTVVVRRSD